VGAREVHLSVKSRAAADAAVRALAERRAANRDRHQVRVHRTPGGFLSGEASAVVAAVEGRPAVPGFTREHLSSSGVRGRPTLVQNVETLAHVALIARYGADWFRRAGTAEQPGTFLATISGAVRRPGVVEAGYGVPLGALLDRAGGPSAPLQAVLIGGYHGAWLPAEAVPEAPVSREGLAPWGASPGAGVVIALPTTACGLDLTARIVSYLAGQSAGQCAPCRNGLPLIADRLGMLAAGTGDPGVVGAVDRLTDLVEGRGVCHHPDGTVRLIRSALRTFADDVTAHLAGFCLATR
jgi:NADH:ubiquinone oxidoreductase subunit F (NADH-binding)